MPQHIARPFLTPVDRLSLRGIRFIEGAPEGGATPPVTAPTPATPAAPATPEAPGAANHDRLNELTPEQLRAEVLKLRDESASKRTAAAAASKAEAEAKAAAEKNATLIEGLSALLGGKPGETPPTPEQLAKTLQERDTALTQASEAQASQAREIAVLRLAPTLNANGDRLLDSRAFTTNLSGVDPTDSAAITAAITEALKTNAAFALTTIAGSSGAGAGLGQQATTPTTLRGAVAQALAAQTKR